MLDKLKEVIKSLSDKKLSQVISQGALKLDEDTTDTISFVFWICYMAENDLMDMEKKAWKITKTVSPTSTDAEVLRIAKEEYDIPLHKIDPDDKDYVEQAIYFSDLIKIKEKLFGKTNFTKLLRKINDIRNDLSHGRINELKYNNESLFLRLTKEKLIIDYFTYILETNKDDSPIWQKLSPEEKEEIENKLDKYFK